MVVIFFIMLLISEKVWSLAIDERLSLRILKVSDSKKTALINRGVEDGLVVGDHAKFFLTTGVVARGVLIKSAPSRSVWSLYQILTPDEINQDKVLNLKISEAVKLTEDVTKAFYGEDEIVKIPEGVALADGVEDDEEKNENSTEEENSSSPKKTDKELTSVDISSEEYLSQKTLELWGLIYFDSLTTSNSYGSTDTGTEGNQSKIDFLVGLEKYFKDYQSVFGKISLLPFIHYSKYEQTNIQGHMIKTNMFAFGGGINYHFLNPPLSVNKLIGFGGLSFGAGRTSDEAIIQGQSTSSALPNIDGSLVFYSVGGGIKYYTNIGIGLRIFADYYRRVETYDVLDTSTLKNTQFTKTISGPRILLGLSYRF
jgi:hypothetical protein